MHDFLFLSSGFFLGLITASYLYSHLKEFVTRIDDKYQQLINIIQLWQKKL
jgi:hypothetical protein